MARTAKELSQEELRAYRPWQNLQRYRKDPEVDKRCDRAWDVARKAAGLLKQQFGAAKVVVFGSVVRRAWFTPWSDVDLAAWGIPVDQFFRAVGAVQDLGTETGFNVDVVDPAECNPEMLESIQAEGIEL